MKSRASVTTSIDGLANGGLSNAIGLMLFSPVASRMVSARRGGFGTKTKRDINMDFLFAMASGCRVLKYQVVTRKKGFDSKRRRLLPILDSGRGLARALPVPIHNRRAHAFSLTSLFGRRDGATAGHHLAMRFASGPT